METSTVLMEPAPALLVSVAAFHRVAQERDLRERGGKWQGQSRVHQRIFRLLDFGAMAATSQWKFGSKECQAH